MEQFLSPDYLQKHYLDYTIINPLIVARKLNRLLRTEEFQQAFHELAYTYDCIRRFEVLEWRDFDIYPKPAQILKGERYLIPAQLESMDWQWCRPPGRPPFYFKNVVSQSCHWRAKVELQLARRLFPDYEWAVVSAERHTAVICPEYHLIFDLTYAAMEVSAQSALHTMFGKDLTDTDYELYLEDYDYSEHTKYIVTIWQTIDAQPEVKRLELCRGMGQHLDEIRADEVTPAAVMKRELVAA